MVSVRTCAPRPLALPKYPSNQAIGSMQISVTSPTIPIGISRSVIGSVSARPAFRARDAAIAPARPLATGLTSLRSVQIAETHCDSHGQTNQVPNPEKSKRQKEIISAHCSPPANTKSLCHIRGQYLRLNDDREYRRHNRSPQHCKQTGAAVLDVRSMFRVSAAADFQDFGAR